MNLQEMTVREINQNFPAAKRVFEKYGIAGCGGTLGPPEPLTFFAQAHQVSLEQLVQDLKSAIAKPDADSCCPKCHPDDSSHEEEMNLYIPFVKLAIVIALTSGTLLGALILSHIAVHGAFQFPFYSLIQAHGHAQIFGWAGLMIMGIAYHILPRFKRTRLSAPKVAQGTLFLMFIGILLRQVAQPGLGLAMSVPLLWTSAVLELSAIACFFGIMMAVFLGSQIAGDFYDSYIVMSLVYFLMAGILNIVQVYQMTKTGIPFVTGTLNDYYLHIALYGFIGMMILGVSLRILPHFLGTREPKKFLCWVSFWFWNIGILGYGLFGPLLCATAEFIASTVFIKAIGIFERRNKPIPIPGIDSAYTWFIDTAYGWFWVAMALFWIGEIYRTITGNAPAHIYVGSYRHALTVGFMTSMILGVGYRIIPVFQGRFLHSSKAMKFSFWLLLAGNSFRVIGQLITQWTRWSYPFVGISGYLELTALALFGWNIWKTLAPEEKPQTCPITPGTRIVNLLRHYPHLRQVLVEKGFTPLKDPSYPIPPFATLRIAAMKHRISVKSLITELDARKNGD